MKFHYFGTVFHFYKSILKLLYDIEKHVAIIKCYRVLNERE